MGEVNPRGDALLRELLWIHGIIRHNLEVIASLVSQIDEGAPADEVRAQISELATSSVVWTLRTNCLQYCGLVHSHHHGEDAMFFPGLRRVNPTLNAAIDKLESDHRVVSVLLDKVESAASRLSDEKVTRGELSSALRALGDLLLTHLDFEETTLAPTLRRLNGWPFG
jgi:Hemerythrin HHE cation binding domain